MVVNLRCASSILCAGLLPGCSCFGDVDCIPPRGEFPFDWDVSSLLRPPAAPFPRHLLTGQDPWLERARVHAASVELSCAKPLCTSTAAAEPMCSRALPPKHCATSASLCQCSLHPAGASTCHAKPHVRQVGRVDGILGSVRGRVRAESPGANGGRRRGRWKC